MTEQDDEIPEYLVARMVRKLLRSEKRELAFIALLPAGYPKPRAELEWQAYKRLRTWWSRPLIRIWIRDYATDNLVPPGNLGSGGRHSFDQLMADVGLLVSGKYARTLSEPKMLLALAGEDAAMGREYRKAQSKRGAAGAKSRWRGKEDLQRIIKLLAGRTDELGDSLPPNELWPLLYAELDEHDLNPQDKGDRYTFASVRRYASNEEITYDAFRRSIQRHRGS